MTDQIQGRRKAEDRVEPVRVDESSTASSKANGRPAARGFDTLAVHAGERAAPVGNWLPISTPIYPSNTFVYPTAAELDAAFDGEGDGYVYTRHGNPTVVAFERAVAALEGAAAAVACGSGMAALHLALLASDVKAGSHVVASRSLYGASATLLEGVFAALGVTVSAIPTEDLDAVAAELAARRPRVLLVETISNPLVRVADLPKLAELSRRHGTALVVDATFTSPYLQRPLELGANLVVHSATKYLGGHGDATGGIVLTSLPMQAAQIQHYLRLTGSVLGPHEAWLLLRGLKTLSLRMQRQCENAAAVADWLAGRPEIARVNYPGRPDHPEHDLAKRLLRDGLGGAIVSFELREGTRAAALRFMDGLQLIQSATTLGDVYTTVLYPPMASHRSQTQAQRQAMGIRDGLVRLSLGIETLADLQTDLAQALAGPG